VTDFEWFFGGSGCFGFMACDNGVLSIVKYPKQSYPEHLIRVIRVAVGVVIIVIGIAQN